MPHPPLTVALSGPPGAGKSALMAALQARLPDAARLAADDLPAPHAMPFDSLARWSAAGADFALLDVAPFVAALAEARDASKAGLLLVEAPLGRAHPAVAALIDRSIWIDTPLDVALARNLLAWRAEEGGPPAAWIDTYVVQYLAVTRRVLVAQRAAVMPQADLVLDGAASVAELAGQVVAWLDR